ncbi:MAG TPA: PDZ domain-containing protein [Planktothrix sp.]|jgi:C-terminal processing protease CtpA/Prc
MSLKQILFTSLIAAFYTSQVCAADLKAAVQEYNSRRFEEARQTFESDKKTTLQSPSTAYYYALTLYKLRQVNQAVEVCEQIVKRFPKSQEAKYSAVIIKRDKPPKVSPELSDKELSKIGVVGLKFVMASGNLPQVGQVFAHGPAEQAGIAKGDLITAVDGVPTKGMTKEEIFNMLVDKPGTHVEINLKRNNEELTRTVKRVSVLELSKVNPQTYRLYRESM